MARLFGAKNVLFLTKKKAIDSIMSDFWDFGFDSSFNIIVCNNESMHKIESNNFDVVIDGAGPVGLLAAINLHKAGIKTAIFEKQKVRSNLSRALVIHAGTLELLEETHPDLLQKFLSEGKKLQQGHLGEKYIVDLSLIESKYNFILAIEQNDSEKILEEYFESLGGKVWRGYEFFDAEISSKKVLSNSRRNKSRKLTRHQNRWCKYQH